MLPEGILEITSQFFSGISMIHTRLNRKSPQQFAISNKRSAYRVSKFQSKLLSRFFKNFTFYFCNCHYFPFSAQLIHSMRS